MNQHAQTILHWLLALVFPLALVCCAVPPPPESCEDACQDLVLQCGFAAFPSNLSCTEGCLYESSEGGQVATLQECIEAADCDLFAIIECQNAFGAER